MTPWLLHLLACGSPPPLAADLSIDEVLLGQTATVPLVLDGAPVQARQTTVIADRGAALRVTLAPESGFEPRRVRVVAEGLDADGWPVELDAQALDVGAEGAELTLELDADSVTSTAAIRVSVFEVDGVSRGEAGSARRPADRFLSLDAQAVPPLELVLVPLRFNDVAPELDDAALAELEAALLRFIPTSQVLLSVHPDGMERDGGVRDSEDLAEEVYALGALHQAEGAAPSVLYYGLYSASDGAGLAGGMDFQPELRAAVGPWEGSARNHKTMAHELGHLLGAMHTPSCGPDSVDPGFPDEEGAVGIATWDPIAQVWLPPETPDLMGYCEDSATSPYTAQRLVDGLRYWEAR
ncbi:MAG: hypothetical protein VX899_09090 [Myxococcota bacterium]|nr:hypothetical protein [Myxococcota bacterium]